MTTGELMARRAAQKLKERHADPELVNMLEAFAEDAEKKRDYTRTVKCLECSWSGSAYHMLVPVRFPGLIRCPVCGSENPVVESVRGE